MGYVKPPPTPPKVTSAKDHIKDTTCPNYIFFLIFISLIGAAVDVASRRFELAGEQGCAHGDAADVVPSLGEDRL